jgi:sugar lactone lactonase YvrE
LFQWDANWPGLPDDLQLGNTHGGIAVDSARNVYFNTDSENAIIKMMPKGKMEKAIGEGLKGGAHGICIAGKGQDEHLYVAHTGRHEVIKMSLDGKPLATFPWPEASGHYETKEQFNPTAVAVSPNGRVYVADGYGKSWIHIYTADGGYKGSFGGPGTGPGKFRTPHGITLDERFSPALLLISDRENRRLQHFTLRGEFVGVVAEDLRRPCGVSIRGNHCAVAELEGRVTILDQKFRVVGHLGDQPDKSLWATNQVGRDKWVDGQFLSPHAVCWNRDGDLFVMDWSREGRVTRLARMKPKKGEKPSKPDKR